MNFQLNVKDVKINTFILTGEIKDQEIIENLKNFVINDKEKDLNHKTHVKGHFTGFKSLINNEYFHNFLKLIQPQIKIIYPDDFIISGAWGNLCKKNEEVTEHDHRDTSAFCGILYLTDKGPGTYFTDFDLLVEEKTGRYVLFHPYLLHSVGKIKDEIERITVAFNINSIKNWENNNITYINKYEI
jgi:hypothetical protein